MSDFLGGAGGGLEQPMKYNCSASLAAEVKHSWNIIKQISKFLKYITLIMFHMHAHQFNQLGIEWVVLNAVGPFHFIQRLYCSTCYYEL